MLSRFRNALGIAILLALLIVIPVLAGGWAVITLDELPVDVVAGQPFTIGFTVLQHGRTPMEGLDPTITASFREHDFVVHAEPGAKTGHYTATLTFPQEGEWKWSIQAFTMDQAMPVLRVGPAIGHAASPAVAQSEPITPSVTPLGIASTLALATGIIGGIIAFRRRNRLAVALTVACLLVGVALPIAGSGYASPVEAQSKSAPEVAASTTVAQVEFGRQLFIAKGCITCHYNSKAGSSSEYWTIEMGAPNLSNFSADPQIIFMRLKDPSSVKSDTKMPNLDLKKYEIEALVAFINSR